MTEEQIALASRAVACRGWRWMAGMRYRLHPTHPWFRFDGDDCCDDDGNPITQAPPNLQSRDAIPDLRDAATMGCLLALVREAHACPYLQVSVSISREHGYRFEANPHHRGAWVDSEEEALVAALEAAP